MILKETKRRGGKKTIGSPFTEKKKTGDGISFMRHWQDVLEGAVRKGTIGEEPADQKKRKKAHERVGDRATKKNGHRRNLELHWGILAFLTKNGSIVAKSAGGSTPYDSRGCSGWGKRKLYGGNRPGTQVLSFGWEVWWIVAWGRYTGEEIKGSNKVSRKKWNE